ncbi:MAG: hypothetical protein P1P84_15050 [Deferrisomatales bacterium]|nr:hypothetical protein [Deferrisomatales bacterium]
MSTRRTNREPCLQLAHNALLVETGLQVFVSGDPEAFRSEYRKVPEDDIEIYVFPPGGCYYLAVKDNLVIEIPEDAFGHLVSTGTVIVCVDDPGAYLMTHAFTLHLPKDRLLEAKGAYAAHSGGFGPRRSALETAGRA